MFRFTIRDVLWLMVVVGMWCVRLDAEESWPTFKQLVRQPDTTLLTNAVQWHASLHSNPHFGGTRDLLLISWFVGDGYSTSRYTVSETGKCDDALEVPLKAERGRRVRQLTKDDVDKLTRLIHTLPDLKAEPPINRTVLVSFQSGDKWRTETYDAAALPDEFELVMKVIGERPETAKRHNQK